MITQYKPHGFFEKKNAQVMTVAEEIQQINITLRLFKGLMHDNYFVSK